MITTVIRRQGTAMDPAQRETGLSLIELMVAMVIASLLFAAVGTVFVGTLRGTRTVNTKTSTGADVRLAMEAMSRTLKVATKPVGETAAFRTATSTGMSFFALLNRTGSQSTSEPIPTLVAYTWSSSANCLTESQTPGTPKASPPSGGPFYDYSTGTTSKCLLSTISPPSFIYYPSGNLTATAMTPATGLSTSNMALVRSVLVTLIATDPNNPTVAGIPAETRISLENLINADGS